MHGTTNSSSLLFNFTSSSRSRAIWSRAYGGTWHEMAVSDLPSACLGQCTCITVGDGLFVTASSGDQSILGAKWEPKDLFVFWVVYQKKLLNVQHLPTRLDMLGLQARQGGFLPRVAHLGAELHLAFQARQHADGHPVLGRGMLGQVKGHLPGPPDGFSEVLFGFFCRFMEIASHICFFLLAAMISKNLWVAIYCLYLLLCAFPVAFQKTTWPNQPNMPQPFRKVQASPAANCWAASRSGAALRSAPAAPWPAPPPPRRRGPRWGPSGAPCSSKRPGRGNPADRHLEKLKFFLGSVCQTKKMLDKIWMPPFSDKVVNFKMMRLEENKSIWCCLCGEHKLIESRSDHSSLHRCLPWESRVQRAAWNKDHLIVC